MDGDTMPKYTQDDEQISDGVNLLISILVRYPEIGTISFDPLHNSIKLTFMLSSILTAQEFEAIKTVVLNSIKAYLMLSGAGEHKADVQLSSYDRVTMLVVSRDVATLSKGEITLLITLLRDKFRDVLVTDNNDAMLEEDLLIQEELIDNMLQNVKSNHTVNRLIGIREDGRVLVFNK